jgi:hypothetical protein
MTVGDRSDADAEYQGLELGLRHADLADIIARTARWARAFDVRTPYFFTDESRLISHPLKPYAVALEAIRVRLARAVTELAASLDPSSHGGLENDGLAAPALESDMPGDPVTYLQGGNYVLWLQPRSRYHVTYQDRWRAAIEHAWDYLPEVGASTEGLSWYATVVQDLLDDAFALARGAYADAVAATYGRVWATHCGADDPRGLIAWMRALTDVGFDDADCESVLCSLEAAFPEAVARCRSVRSWWQPTALTDR